MARGARRGRRVALALLAPAAALAACGGAAAQPWQLAGGVAVLARASRTAQGLEGPYEAWWRTGEREATGQHAGGLRAGAWRFFHPNGRLKATGAYRDGEMDGPWTWWDARGEEVARVVYAGGRPAGGPDVGLPPPADGACPRADAAARLDAAAPAWTACTGRGGRAGRLVLALRVAPDGRVAEARASSSSLDDAEAEACLLAAARAVPLPMPGGGAGCELTWAVAVTETGALRP